ncbi:DUF3310 domain-containing protein [Kocuria sp.]|uniref:DUF3310 domain-containing protein n=1 Tax=Kocuria sp. TaxID=1871328 RepID=UPI0026DB64BF|nr:DUF3310 domain-containing protein [Kocuria sp.]MDO4919919.1 DUF3310 domain-containing protein [Kocuria sp.]
MTRLRDTTPWAVQDNSDPINPAHYQGFSNGAQVIDITENLPFNAGNAVKYLARAGRKHAETHAEDLRKALWYVRRELARITGEPEPESSPAAPVVTPEMVQLVLDTYAEHEDIVTRERKRYCAECDAPLVHGLTPAAHARNMAAATLEDAIAKAGRDAQE